MPQSTFIARDHDIAPLLCADDAVRADARVLMHEHGYNADHYLIVDGSADIDEPRLDVIAIRHEDRQFMHLKLVGTADFSGDTHRFEVDPVGIDYLELAMTAYGRGGEFEALKAHLRTHVPEDIAADWELLAALREQVLETLRLASTDKGSALLKRMARDLAEIAA